MYPQGARPGSRSLSQSSHPSHAVLSISAWPSSARGIGGCFAVDLVGSEELHSQLHGLLVRPQGRQGSVSLFTHSA